MVSMGGKLLLIVVLCVWVSESYVLPHELYVELNLNHEEVRQITLSEIYFDRNLKKYFKDHAITRQELYDSAVRFIKNLRQLQEKHLSKVNNVILGSRNIVGGNDNILHGNYHRLKGNNNFVLDGSYPQFDIFYDNIIRIWIFDFDMNRVEKLKTNPYEAVNQLKM